MLEEIEELRRRGVEVIPASGKAVRIDKLSARYREVAKQTLFLHPPAPWLLLHALWLCLWRMGTLGSVLRRIVLQGDETPKQRVHALGHTWLGACYALQMAKRGVQHIHAHHGYFSSWVAIVAARLLGIEFSLTLHGSDLLRNAPYLDLKLQECACCFTISEFNRRYLLEHYPRIEPAKIILRRLGVDSNRDRLASSRCHTTEEISLFAVGRLHPVKDHAFLVRACFLLRQRGVRVRCSIAGDGPERERLQQMIRELQLEGLVKLLGHVEREKLGPYYRAADIVALTSQSEGIPLVLMEAMAEGAIVLAPAITGIPELVIPGKTGFLFTPGSQENFVRQVELIRSALPQLGQMRGSARKHVFQQFNRTKNLEAFAGDLLQQLNRLPEYSRHENPILQQI